MLEDLKKLDLPDVLCMNDGSSCCDKEMWENRRQEILDIFKKEVYGEMPPPPKQTTYEIISTYNNAVAGFAIYHKIRIMFDTPKGKFSFLADLYLPTNVIKCPVMIYLQFNDSPLHRVFPVEDLIKQGFATLLIRYNDVMLDVVNFNQGLAGMFLSNTKNVYDRKPAEWGAIGCWAYAASRALDVCEQIDSIDATRAAIIGHSRLGKTAMWCAANDTRFALSVINGSGNTGAALSRGNSGENIEYIVKHFPHWFCTNYYKYANDEENLPFDQHYILATIAPRKAYVCSGAQDFWASPKSEFLSCVAASKAWEICGEAGIVTKNHYPEIGDVLDEGNLMYSLHDGGHYIGRFEWEEIAKILGNHKA